MPAGVSAWTPLANTTLGSAQSSVTFSSISGSYRDLVLVMTPATSGFGGGPFLQLNASGFAFRWTWAEGDGTTTYVGSSGNLDFPLNPENTISSAQTVPITIQFLDYISTDKHKHMVYRYGSAGAGVGMGSARWPSTAAITTIIITAATGGRTLSAGSTFALYGVSA